MARGFCTVIFMVSVLPVQDGLQLLRLYLTILFPNARGIDAIYVNLTLDHIKRYQEAVAKSQPLTSLYHHYNSTKTHPPILPIPI